MGYGSRSDFTLENVKNKGDYVYDYNKMGSFKYTLEMSKLRGTKRETHLELHLTDMKNLWSQVQSTTISARVFKITMDLVLLSLNLQKFMLEVPVPVFQIAQLHEVY